MTINRPDRLAGESTAEIIGLLAKVVALAIVPGKCETPRKKRA
ncbi:MAG: hypothetical protein ACT4P7_03225 [Gemmatimonadaceae bacterium]